MLWLDGSICDSDIFIVVKNLRFKFLFSQTNNMCIPGDYNFYTHIHLTS